MTSKTKHAALEAERLRLYDPFVSLAAPELKGHLSLDPRQDSAQSLSSPIPPTQRQSHLQRCCSVGLP